MARKTKYEIRTLKTETDDVNQYNALLRYAFQVTEQELAETGWRDDEIKQSKFPVLDRADVLGCNLHGSVYYNHCMKCGKAYAFTDMLSCKGIPHCTCGGIIKPDVVLYEEPLNESTVNGAVRHIMNADMLIVAGTSLTVYPAAGLIRYFRGRNSVLINRDANVGDDEFSLVIHGKVGEVLGSLVV